MSRASLGEMADISVLREGVDHFWNFRFKKAEEMFGPKCQLDMPGWSFLAYDATVAWARATITELPDDVQIAFAKMHKARMAVNRSKSIKLPNPKDPPLTQAYLLLGKLIYARMLLFDAFLKFKLDQKIKGAYNIRKSWKYFEAAMAYKDALPANTPSYNDLAHGVDFGYGIFLFLVSVVPKEWMWLVETLGFEGNRLRGLQLLTSSAESNTVFALESSFNLIWIHAFFFEDFFAAQKVVDSLLTRFPTGSHVKYMGGYIARKQGKLEQAASYFQQAALEAAEIKQFQGYCDYDLGYNSFLALDWHSTIGKLQPFVEDAVNEVANFKAYSHYMLAMCYEMLFQQDKAMPLMRKLQEVARKSYDYDEFADRKAKRYLSSKGISLFQRKFFMASLHNEACRPDEVLDALESASTLAETLEDRLCVTYLRGSAYFKKDHLDEAKKCFEEVMQNEKLVKLEMYILPHSLVGLGEIALKRQQWDDAERSLKKAKSYSSYDFSQLLQWRIIRGLDIVYNFKKGRTSMPRLDSGSPQESKPSPKIERAN